MALLRDDVGKQTRGNSEKSTKFQRGWSYHEQGGDATDRRKDDEYECRKGGVVANDNELEYCGFVPCTDVEDGPTDEDGWSYYADFSPQSLLAPTRSR